MRKITYFKTMLLAIMLLMGSGTWAQTNSYLGLDGGFEGTATIDNSIGQTAQVSKWTKANTSITIASETSIVRSGSKSLKLTPASSPYRVYSPQFTISTSTTKWVIQYYRRSASNTNTTTNGIGNIRGSTETPSSYSYSTVTAADTWEKVTYAPTSIASASTVVAVIMAKILGTGGDMYFDDFCVYESSSGEDNTLPDAPTSPIINTGSTSLNISWTAPGTGVDGGGYLVVRGTADPTTAPNVNGIYTVGNTIGSGTVVFQGTGTNFTDASLSTGTTYYYRTYTYDKAYNYSSAILSNATPITNFYTKSTGNLDILSNWGTSTDGTGVAPTDFTSNNQIFNIRNNATPTIGANWTVSGTNSKIIVGDGTNACNFTIPLSFAVTGTIDVAANATLTNSNSTNPTFGTLDANSTISFTGTSAQTIPAATYGNLNISTTGGNATVGGAIGITTALTVASSSVLDMSINALTGSSLTTSGTGTLKIQNTTSAPIPIGRIWTMDIQYNGAAQTVVTGTYSNLKISNSAGTKSPNGNITLGNNNTFTLDAGVTYSAGTSIMNFGTNGTANINGIFQTTTTTSSSFSGAATSSISNTNTPTITLGTGSTVEYTSISGQTITTANSSGSNGTLTYYNLLISGTTGTKTFNSSPAIAAGGTFTVNSNCVADMVSTQMIFGAGCNVVINGTLNTQKATGGLSGSSSSVFISTNSPVISLGSSSTINYNGTGNQAISTGSYANLVISQTRSSSTLTLPSGTINISGTFNYTATSFTTFTTTGNTIVYNGSGNQTIAAIPYNNLTINNSTGATIDQNINVTSLTINSGAKLTLNTGKTLTATIFNINSDTSGTGTFLDNGTTTITGTTSVQQYLSSARNWYISSPVSNAQPPVSGYTFNERYETGASWRSLSTPNFLPGTGYIALPNSDGQTLTFSTQTGGSLNAGNVPVPLTISGATYNGYNLIGNPYPCHLTWTKAFVNNNSSLINPTIWYRTNAGTTNNSGLWSFLTYNAVSEEGTPTAANGIVPPMQAFWVRAVSAGTLTLNSDLTLSHQSSNPLKAPAVKSSDRQRLRLQVNNGTSTDETLIYFDANASNGYDAYDSPKFEDATTVTQIYTTAGTEKLVINGMNSIPLDTEIGLGFVPGSATSFSIKANEVSNLPSDIKVILKDNVTLAETNLTNGVNTYEFSPATTTTNRFSVIFRTAGAISAVPTAANDQNLLVYRNANNQIAVQIKGQLNDSYALDVYNSTGQRLTSKRATAGITIMDAPQSGVYFVTIKGNGNNTTKKVVIN